MRLPARKFRTYKCVGASALEAAVRLKQQDANGAAPNENQGKEEEGPTSEVVEQIPKVQ